MDIFAMEKILQILRNKKILQNVIQFVNWWKSNKRPMGHIAHLRKQFKSINTYDNIITLFNKRRKNQSFTLWEFNCSSFEQTWIPFIQECIVPSLVGISSVFLEKKIFKFVNVFSLFHYILPWKKGLALHLNKLESSSPKDALCQVLL